MNIDKILTFGEGLLTIPNFSKLRSKFNDKLISLTWMNMDVVLSEGICVPEHWEQIRPSYDLIGGEGGSLVMPGSAIWLSTPNNLIHLPSGTDESFISHAVQMGILHNFVVSQYKELENIQLECGLPVMACDEFPDNQKLFRVSSEQAFRSLNQKSALSSFSSYHAPYMVRKINDLTISDYESFRGKKFYIKKDNTEAVGQGVLPIRTKREFLKALNDLKLQRQSYPELAPHVILQGSIDGQSKSFQYYHTPSGPVELISVSQQFVNEQGVYMGSYNPPLELELITEAEKSMIHDMSQKVRLAFPELEGVIMNDYILNEDRVFTLDPGLRPSGNTGVAIARMFVQEHTGFSDVCSMTFALNPKGEPFTFSEYFKGKDDLLKPESLEKNGFTLMPWGFNPIQGLPVMALCFREGIDLQTLQEEVKSNF